MKRDTMIPLSQFKTSFLSVGKDTETILNKLFIQSGPYSEHLKRLLIINAKDCLSNTDSKAYQAVIKKSVKQIIDEGYIKLIPKIEFEEHAEVKAYVIVSYDNFMINATNPEFRDCTVNFDIICHTDYWDIDNYEVRPLKIAGYIDGILNETKLSGIGTFNFIGCNQIILNEELSGYTLSYRAVHGTDDRFPAEEE